jgi:transcriptional regulator with XRE-family HTH domain
MTHSSFRLRQNLASLLKARGITAAEVSRRSGIAKQVLSDWLTGVQPRKLEQLYAVAQILGVSIETLCFTASEEPILTKQSTSPQEIRGKYEVYLRKIAD